jgi:ABC-type transporter Mla subunit MlaD
MTRRLALTLAAAGAITLAVLVASVRGRGGTREFSAVFPSASGLHEGALVTYLGVAVGEVGPIDLSSGRVVARLRIRRHDVTLRAADEVRLRTMGLLGDAAVDITPGLRDAVLLEPGDTLFGAPLSAGSEPAKPIEALIRGGARKREEK